MKKLILFLSIILLITSCASKRYAKKATKFEKAGLYEEAANYYFQSLQKKASNVDAVLGLRKDGQIVLDRKLANFTKAYKQSEFKTAVYNYLEAEKYYNKIKTVNIELSFPEYNKEYYKEAKDDYLGKIYASGIEAINREDFIEAEKIFGEIVGIDKEYKDVKEQYIIAKYEPMYRKGNQELDNNLFRSAYYTFEKIINGSKRNYKQSLELKAEALKKATITILIPEFSNRVNYRDKTSSIITSKIKGDLSNLKNPFIKVIELSSLSSNILNNNRSINYQAANLAGIKTILIGEVIQSYKNEGKLLTSTKRGYLKEVTKVKNEQGEEKKEVKYHKTTYTDNSKTNKANIKVNFKLISTETNEVLTSDNVSLVAKDKVHYARFNGDNKKLIPGYWKYKGRKTAEDVVKDNSVETNKLHKLLKANSSIKSSDALLNGLFVDVSKQISEKIDKYNPEK